MKVTFLSPDEGREAELEQLSWLGSLKHVVLPDLQLVDDAALRRAHAHVFDQVFRCNGIDRMAIGVRVLTPIQEETQRRGMEADYWSMEHKLRSDLAYVLGERRDCDAVKHPEMAQRLDHEADEIRNELAAYGGDRERDDE
jgi:hypothetical protein